MPEFRYVGDHPVEAVVGDTRPMLASGDFITLEGDDLENEQNKALGLVPVNAPASDEASNKDSESEAGTTTNVASETTEETAEGGEK
jgi:hypothetical protein